MRSCLIVGNPNTFSESIIDRLDKEGWRVSTLSCEKFTGRQERVFEQYEFEYASESVSGVISSCRPDVILYMGAYDANFTGDGSRTRESLRSYIAGLSNLLICSGKQGVRHFLHLSSEGIFEDNYVTDINEDMPVSPESYKQMVIYQGETIALKYNKVSTMEVTVVRLDGLYFIPKHAGECGSLCADMCLRALRGETLSVNAKRITSALYDSDATEALFRLIDAPTREHHLYHIASSECFSDLDLANTIQASSLSPVHIEDATTGLTSQRVLSSERFNAEFHFSARVSYRDVIPKMIAAMQSKLINFRKDGASEDDNLPPFVRFMRRAIPYIELLLGVLACFFLTRLLGDRLESINLFLLYVLLFASFYGSRHGILAAFLSSVAYCILEVFTRTGLELLVDVNTYVWIAQVFIVGLATGNVRDQMTQTKQDMNQEVSFLSSRLKDVSNINDSNVQIKNFFEERVVDSGEGMGHIYSIISELDKAESGAVMFTATSILMQLMGTKDVSIYQVAGGYSRVAASTSPRARALGKSITNSKIEEIFHELEEKRAYINRRLNPELPYLAGALMNEDGGIGFIVLLWDVGYDHMTMYYLNMLRVICALIENAVSRSVKYLDAVSHSRLVPDTAIMREAAFSEYVGIYRAAHEKKLTEYCLLMVDIQDDSLAAWNQRLSSMLRHTDSIGVINNQSLGILLTNTNQQEAMVVINRMRSKGIQAVIIA